MNSALFIRVHNFQERIVFLLRKHKSRRVKKRKKSIEREKSITFRLIPILVFDQILKITNTTIILQFDSFVRYFSRYYQY